MCYFQSNVIYITFYIFDEIVLFDNKENEIKILERKSTIEWWSFLITCQVNLFPNIVDLLSFSLYFISSLLLNTIYRSNIKLSYSDFILFDLEFLLSFLCVFINCLPELSSESKENKEEIQIGLTIYKMEECFTNLSG